MNLLKAFLVACLCLCHHVSGAAQSMSSLLQSVPEPPSDINASAWKLRDAAEGAAYLAHVLVDDALPAHEITIAQKQLRFTLDNLINRLADGTWWTPASSIQGDPNVNRFVLTALLDALWIIRGEPDFSASWGQWKSKLRSAMDFQIRAYRGEVAWDWGAKAGYSYPNQDVLHTLSLSISARLFLDNFYAAEAEKAFLSLQRNQMPGGGWHYIAGENESPIYHALVQAVLARYVDITEDDRARSMLGRSAAYWRTVLSAQGVAEAWSDVWWKQNWLPIPSAVVRTAAIAANDSVLAAIAKKIFDRESQRAYRVTWADAYTYKWKKIQAPAYVAESATPLSIDVDQHGVHGRDGTWFFGVTKGRGLRNTFVGAMVESEDGVEPLVAAFRGAQVVVTDSGAERGKYSLSQQNDNVEISVRSNRALLFAQYQLQPARINGVPPPQDVDSPWSVRQLWSAGADGVMGTVELRAIRDNAAMSVTGRIPLGPCSVIPEGAATWRCGGMRVHIFESWGRTMINHVGAAYPSPVDRWDGIEWRADLNGVRAGDIFRYRVWVGPVSAKVPSAIEICLDGWIARWGNDKSLRVQFLDGSIKSSEKL